jgi:hypothetical protein
VTRGGDGGSPHAPHTLRHVHRAASVQHTCDVCRKAIRPGERYELFVRAVDGRFEVRRAHQGERCAARPNMFWLWVDTTFGCGGVAVDGEGHVVDAAPIFRRSCGLPPGGGRGRYFLDVVRRWRRVGVFRGWHRITPVDTPQGRR